ASFAAGSMVTAEVERDRYRVFDLRIYHAVPGKVPKLVARFQDAVPLFEKHHLDVLGYWVPAGDRPGWQDTFVYLLGHRNLEEAKRNWDAFHKDPAFQKYVREEKEEKLIESDDRTYMSPTDYSQMK